MSICVPKVYELVCYITYSSVYLYIKENLLRSMNPLVLAFRLRRRGLGLANRKSFRISLLNLAIGTLATIIRVPAPSFSGSISVCLSWDLGYYTRVSSLRESKRTHIWYREVTLLSVWNDGVREFLGEIRTDKGETRTRNKRGCSANFEQLYLFVMCTSWWNTRTLRAYKEHTWLYVVSNKTLLFCI